MNQAQSNSFNVNSKFFIQQLDTLIIQIVRAIAIEHSIKPDPDAKESVRKILLTRAHELMSEQSKQFVSDYKKAIKDRIKSASKPGEHVPNSSYEILKLMGLDDA